MLRSHPMSHQHRAVTHPEVAVLRKICEGPLQKECNEGSKLHALEDTKEQSPKYSLLSWKELILQESHNRLLIRLAPRDWRLEIWRKLIMSDNPSAGSNGCLGVHRWHWNGFCTYRELKVLYYKTLFIDNKTKTSKEFIILHHSSFNVYDIEFLRYTEVWAWMLNYQGAWSSHQLTDTHIRVDDLQVLLELSTQNLATSNLAHKPVKNANAGIFTCAFKASAEVMCVNLRKWLLDRQNWSKMLWNSLETHCWTIQLTSWACARSKPPCKQDNIVWTFGYSVKYDYFTKNFY